MLDKVLIDHCSPTLGGLKTANLFNYPCSSCAELEGMLAGWNKVLNPKGVALFSLGCRRTHMLVYVCRISRLENDLRRDNVQEFLLRYGYRDLSIPCCIEKLRKRLQESSEFPHEIGLFLGYPLADVKGFIENDGQNFKCTGCWKVYCNECETSKLFMKYKKCKAVYTKLFLNRERSVLDLTVAV